jgi:penicillin-binding protein-related factor A (putative recombinase)
MTPNEVKKLSQKLFEQAYKEAYGKKVYIHRFTDTGDIRARYQGKTVAHIPKQPSDYHVSLYGQSFYAEVKGTSNKTSFPFSNFEESQLAAMKRLRDIGNYNVFIYSVHLNLWYTLNAGWLLHLMEDDVKSFNFNNNPAFLWTLGNEYGRA